MSSEVAEILQRVRSAILQGEDPEADDLRLINRATGVTRDRKDTNKTLHAVLLRIFDPETYRDDASAATAACVDERRPEQVAPNIRSDQIRSDQMSEAKASSGSRSVLPQQLLEQ